MRVVTGATPVAVMLVDPAEPHLAELLGAGGFAVHVCGPGDLVRTATTLCPHVVVIDLDGTAGTAAVETLTATLPRLPVLALSSAGGAAAVLTAVRAGAAGYALRGSPASWLVEAVRRTAVGDAVYSPGLAASVLEQHAAGAVDGPVRLTERESDVLALVVAGRTARQIATRLTLSPRTVENHVNNMLRRFDVPNRAALVRYAIENGLA
ncbi:MAG: LuxR C-terminal-related transcriptional regulator [Pseudonocardia sp.]